MINIRNNNGARGILSFVLMLIVVGAVGLYISYQSRALAAGPNISFTSPENGATVHDSLALIKGSAERIAFIELNGKRIYIDEFGEFSEKLPLLEGHNIIELQAKDRFGRTTTKNLYLLYESE